MVDENELGLDGDSTPPPANTGGSSNAPAETKPAGGKTPRGKKKLAAEDEAEPRTYLHKDGATELRPLTAADLEAYATNRQEYLLCPAHGVLMENYSASGPFLHWRCPVGEELMPDGKVEKIYCQCTDKTLRKTIGERLNERNQQRNAGQQPSPNNPPQELSGR